MSRQDTLRPHARSRVENDRRRRVMEVAKGLSTTLGNDFFRSMVKNLGIALHVDCVYLGELTGTPASRLDTIAVHRRRSKGENFAQPLQATAPGQVVQDGSLARSQDVRQIFPQDTELERMQAEGYVGIRLSDSTGNPIGLLAVVSAHRLSDLELVKSVLETFAPRAASEIERKRADDLHRENEQRYHAFVSSNPDGMWRIEFEQPISLSLPEEEQLELIYRFGYLAECNDASARFYGHQSAEEFVGCRFNEIVPLTDVKLLRELRQQIHTGFRFSLVESSCRDDNGDSSYRLRSQFAIVEDGKLQRLWGTTRDLTSLRRTELLAAASERRFRQVLENAQLPAFILNTQGTIAFCNDCFLGLVNQSRATVSEWRWLEGAIPAEEAETWESAFSDDEPPQAFLGEILQGSGSSPRIIHWNVIRLQDENDKVTAVAALGRDLTYERALEADNRLAQKMESAGRLAAGVAHDFNNILTVVRGQTEQLLATTEESNPATARLRAIDAAVLRCVDLVDKLLSLGRKQHLRPEHIDLDEVVDAETGIIASILGDGIELVIKRRSQLWVVYADPSQIQRILSNLVSNARDAMRRGGRLVIETSNLTIREHDTEYPGVRPGTFVRLTVADDGVGLTKEVQQHIFEPFYTAKRSGKGLGLGLPTVYGIVAQSGGHITLRSEPGKGTTIEILLPAITRDAPK